MRRLIVQQNQVTYAAQFSRPAFALWGDGKRILDRLYTAFVKRGITLASIRVDQTSQDLSAQSVIVSFGASCFYKFQFDRIESILNNFRRDELAAFPEMLKEGADWLRSSIPDFSFQSHLFTYFGHMKLSEGTSQDVLSSLSTILIPEIGASEGNGIIFHWKLPDPDRRAQLLIDHSLTFPDGLFIQFLFFVTGDSINYSETAATGRSIMDLALSKIDLEIDNAN